MSLTMKGKRRQIGVDVDGILADFCPAYASLCSDVSGKVVSPLATKWQWVRDYGVTAAQEGAVWDHIRATPTFWHALSPLPEASGACAYLEGLSADHNVYFMTHRPENAKFWTELWLSDLGVQNPTVLCSDQKGKLAQALSIDLFIDDKVENVLEVYRSLPIEARVYLYKQPWNTTTAEQWEEEGGDGVRIATTFDQIWEAEGLAR